MEDDASPGPANIPKADGKCEAVESRKRRLEIARLTASSGHHHELVLKVSGNSEAQKIVIHEFQVFSGESAKTHEGFTNLIM